MSMAPGTKIVLVHRYFAPDSPPYAHILAAIARRLADEGHDVTVLSCQPSYRPDLSSTAPPREHRDGYEIVRFPVMEDRSSHFRKLANLVWFCLRLLGARAHFRGADVVMAATTPPILLALVVSLRARSTGARFIYHKQDIYPEVVGPELSMPLRALRRLDASTESRADEVVVLSEDMAETVRARTLGRASISVLNNFDPWQHTNSSRSVRDLDGPLRLAFAGNLGHFQGLDQVRRLIDLVADESRIQFHFFGDGARSTEFENLSRESPSVVAHGYRPAEEVARFIRDCADIGIVSLEPGVIRAAYPSKTMSYLRNGCPILALVEPSELYHTVVSARIGIAASGDDLDMVAVALRRAVDDRSELNEARVRAFALYTERFAAEQQLDRWAELFEQVVDR